MLSDNLQENETCLVSSLPGFICDLSSKLEWSTKVVWISLETLAFLKKISKESFCNRQEFVFSILNESGNIDESDSTKIIRINNILKKEVFFYSKDDCRKNIDDSAMRKIIEISLNDVLYAHMLFEDCCDEIGDIGNTKKAISSLYTRISNKRNFPYHLKYQYFSTNTKILILKKLGMERDFILEELKSQQGGPIEIDFKDVDLAKFSMSLFSNVYNYVYGFNFSDESALETFYDNFLVYEAFFYMTIRGLFLEKHNLNSQDEYVRGLIKNFQAIGDLLSDRIRNFGGSMIREQILKSIGKWEGDFVSVEEYNQKYLQRTLSWDVA